MSGRPPRMARARMEVLTDILLMLAELPDYNDAIAVIAALNRLDSASDLHAMFRPCDLPATTRRDLVSKMIVGRFARHPAYDTIVQIQEVNPDDGTALVEHSPNMHAWVSLEDLELD